MTFPVEQSTIFLALAGSQAHGTAREGSDVDVRGICVAPLASRLSLFETFEQYEGVLPEALETSVCRRLESHPTASRGLDVKVECVIFDIAKIVRLASDANPTALELLFAAEDDWLLATPAWVRLHALRHAFLTKRVQQTFLGYAGAQLRRIKSHRSWLLNPPVERPVREAFGLPEAKGTLSRDDIDRLEHAVAERARSEDVSSLAGDELKREAGASALGIPPRVLAALDAEKKYRAALKHFRAYEAWKQARNPARAELERKHGYDTKHAMHLIRLMRMGLEALETGELHVRRQDAAELRAIRDGALSFEELLEKAAALEERMADALTTTTLPGDVDRQRVDALCRDLMMHPEG